jgi:4-diphosphocytidyl-2-C-methyl-D-erythritol kinase
VTVLPGTAVRVEAPAKVNLLLRILERSEDGYHRLETLFQAVDLSDTLTLTVAAGEGFSLEVQGADVGPAEDNLVTRAAEAFRATTGFRAGVRAVLHKRIPAGAGLGGGSSDAGAALRALNVLAGGPLSSGELAAVGRALGADVAFFAGAAGLALGEGRGDRLRPLPPLPPRSLLLGLPPAHVATGPAYGALARLRTEGRRPVPPPLLLGRAPASWAEVESLAVNDFEAVVPAANPTVLEALEALRGAGLPLVLLSGSGAAVFGLVPPGADPGALALDLAVRHPGIRWQVVRTLERLPEPQRVEPRTEMG